MTTERATIWVCTACGKRSHDRNGEKKIDRGWDVSCMMHAVLCYADTYKRGADNGVTASAVKV